MRPPAPRQVVLARDKLRAECALERGVKEIVGSFVEEIVGY